MPRFSNRHPKREQTFSIRSFSDGLNQEVSPNFLPVTALTRCMNMKYAINRSIDGTPRVVLKKRQGTEKLSTSALPAAADVLACTYYVAGAKYVMATAAKLYYLDATYAPVEIGSISGIPTFTEFNGKLIIHDSAVTKYWDGSTFAALGGVHTDEIIGTGDNFGTVAFSGTLESPPITAGSLTITYTDSTGKTMTDGGAGTFTGDGTGTINYTTGAWTITASGAPDNATSIYATYTTTAGAPKSKAGFVRASRLYMWGDADNPSRLWYSGVNDSESWEGYLDVDPLDGYSLIGVMNFFQSLAVVKGNSIQRLNSYPGEADFGVFPLIQNLGGNAYRACINVGDLLAFMTVDGFVGMGATSDYGDIKRVAELSEKFQSQAVKYSNASAYCEHNQIDNQIWLTLHDGTNYQELIYVINLATGGQASMYKFAFDHSCYKFVNGEMLIGGKDGNLYRLFTKDSRYRDNGVSYAADTYCRGTMTNWDMPSNQKHNKYIYPHLYGTVGLTATLNLYKDMDYNDVDSTYSLTVPLGPAPNYDYNYVLNYDMDDVPNGAVRAKTIKTHFNYHDIMFELTNITGALGAEMYGIDFTAAVLGD